MNTERWILIFIIIASLTLLFRLTPKTKKRDAWVLFLFLQVITWVAGLYAVEKGWISYPVQLFKQNINQTSFSFEFYLFPIVAILFSIYYPYNTNKLAKFMYYLIITGFFTCLEVILEKYTRLVRYDEWKWYWTLITVMISLFLNHQYYRWFKKGMKKGVLHDS